MPTNSLFVNGQPIHFDANDGKARVHTVWFPTPRKRCKCWRDFGHKAEYWGGILEETFPELAKMTGDEFEHMLHCECSCPKCAGEKKND